MSRLPRRGSTGPLVRSFPCSGWEGFREELAAQWEANLARIGFFSGSSFPSVADTVWRQAARAELSTSR
eukprot:8300396-Pyramimonas_sp.AAC.1